MKTQTVVREQKPFFKPSKLTSLGAEIISFTVYTSSGQLESLSHGCMPILFCAVTVTFDPLITNL